MCYNQLLCVHKNLLIGYYDIYKMKKYKNLLYEEEKRMIEKKKSFRLERSLFSSKHIMYNKILLGTIMMPNPIGEYLLESVSPRLARTPSRRSASNCFRMLGKRRYAKNV